MVWKQSGVTMTTDIRGGSGVLVSWISSAM
jgi:hypothetical protein